ncbi:MAG: response regulator [Methylocapsa sp.]|nr:response regulator [Methylocapsa sp.]
MVTVKHAAPRSRILIVEDEAFIALALESALKDLGFDIAATAGRLSSALEAAKHGEFEGAIVDLYLGPERADAVADALAARGCPFFFMTGYVAPDLPPRHAKRVVLLKPFRLEELLAALRSEFGLGDHARRAPGAGPHAHQEQRASPGI